MGTVLADYADRPDESDHRSRYRCRQARVRCDDADEKDRHRCNRGGAPWLKLQSSKRACLAFEVVRGRAAWGITRRWSGPRRRYTSLAVERPACAAAAAQRL